MKRVRLGLIRAPSWGRPRAQSKEETVLLRATWDTKSVFSLLRLKAYFGTKTKHRGNNSIFVN